MPDYFNHRSYVDAIINQLKLSNNDIHAIHQRYQAYATQIYTVPVTVMATPTPYSPLRINYKTGQLYVPNKARLVHHLRTLIFNTLGPENFINGFFPRFQEAMLKVNLYLPTPKQFTKENVYLSECKILRPIVTPDLDNISKIINDAVKAFLLYDDAQIVSDLYEKFYSTTPRIELEVVYNASDILPIHEKIITQRKNRWKMLLMMKTKTAIQSLLLKYINI